MSNRPTPQNRNRGKAQTTASLAGSGEAGSARTILGVDYFQRRTVDGGDLFLTRFGLPFAAHLQPDNWLTSPWFEEHRKRLRGTSMIYRTQTRPVQGRSLDIIVRFNRVGQDLPVDTLTRDVNTHATFNSPFEEIAQVMALRRSVFGPRRRLIPTKRALAIYSPPNRLQAWQTGRDERQMAAKQARLPEIQLDPCRSYILIYGWIKGIDVQDAADQLGLGGTSRKELLEGSMEEVEGEMRAAGFHVLDMKPAHIVVRFNSEGRIMRRRDGRLVYALIDYELMEQIPAAEDD
jgi:hypothetical protein